MSEFDHFLTSPSQSIQIIYASETGTSKDASYSFVHRLFPKNPAKLALVVKNASEISSYSYFLEQKEIYRDVIFILFLSTSGDGDAPVSFKCLWQTLLRKELPRSLLTGINFAVFGFGDSSYEKYNACARKFHVRTKQLGAEHIIDLGLGDDQGNFGYFPALTGFIKEVTTILQARGFEFTVEDFPRYIDSFKIEFSNSCKELSEQEILEKLDSSAFRCKVLFNRRLTAQDWFQDTRHIRIESASLAPLNYESGDVAVVWYRNEPGIVERALQYFCRIHGLLSPPPCISIHRTEEKVLSVSSLPEFEGISLRKLFENCLEIGGIPKPSFFALLAQQAADEEAKEKLQELSSMNGIDLYYQYCLRERRSFIDVLEDFPSARLSLSLFLETCPRLIPRKYSIASFPSSFSPVRSVATPLCQSHQLDLCVAVAEYLTPFKRKRFGLCSKFLSELTPSSSHCFISLEKGLLSESKIKEHWLRRGRPLLCIGPGTGIAPIRSLAQELLPQTSSETTAPLAVFFGCRKPEKDHLFEDEWKAASLSDRFFYRVAFSQNQMLKRYVTHSLRENSAFVLQLLQQGATVFISGSAKRMPRDVKKTLLEILVQEGGMSEAAANQMVQSMIARKEYLVDAW